MRSIGAVIGLAAGTLCLGGCVSFDSTQRDALDPATWTNRAWEDEPIELDVPLAVGIDIETFNGDVVVTCDPSLPRARLTLVREATHGFGRMGEARDSLGEIDRRMRIVDTGAGPTLEVDVWTIHREPASQRGHVHLEVPTIDRVRVRTTRGRVVVENVSASLDIETSGGDVRVLTARPMQEPVRIVNLDGDIDYRVSERSRGQFDCRAVRGKVDYRVTRGRMVVHSGTDGEVLQATLNDGTNPVTLHTVAGNVRVAVIDDPTNIGARIFGP